MKKTIITVVGKDCVGMVVDANNSPKENHEIAEDLDAIGKEIGVIIKAQHEDIFDMMHRI